MAKKDDGRLSLRAYARRCGSNHVTVMKAVNNGVIKSGWDAEHSKIIVEAADREWGAAYMVKNGVEPGVALTEKQRKQADAVDPQPPVPEGLSFDNSGFVMDKIKSLPATPQEKKLIREAEQQIEENLGSGIWTGGEIPNTVQFAEALRIERILMAGLRRLQRDELEGLLVRKSEVNKQLQVAGIEIRKAIERIPAMVIDDVLAAKDRAGGLRKLEEVIAGVLDGLNDVIIRAVKQSNQ